MKEILIIAGGFFCAKQEKFILSSLRNNPGITLIACDSGANYLHSLNIIPHILIGDLDSLDKDLLETLKNTPACKVISFNQDKDDSDLELAINHALTLNPLKITCLACLGGRQDYSYVNINLIASKADANRDIDFEIISSEYKINFLKQKELYELSKEGLKDFSLISFSPETTGVTITGAKWNLQDKTLLFGQALGVSNIATENKVTIQYTAGNLGLFAKTI